MIFVALGAAFGFLGGLFGTSGGLVAVPVLVIFFSMVQQGAEGTALVMIVPNLALGFWRYAREGDINRRLALILGIAAIPLSIVAALLAVRLPHEVLRHAFGIFAVAVAAFMGVRAFVPASDGKRLHLPFAYAVIPGAIGGAIAGLFSSGAAVFSVAALDYGFALPQVAAQGLATLVEFPATVTSLGIFAAAHDVHWVRGAELAAGGAVTVHLGARLAHRLPERILRLLFFFYVIAAAAGLFLKHG